MKTENNARRIKGGCDKWPLPFICENSSDLLLTQAIIFRPSVISFRNLSMVSAVLYQICVFKNIALFF